MRSGGIILDMSEGILPQGRDHGAKWLAVLDKHGIGHPKSLHTVELQLGGVQATSGEPPGMVALDPFYPHVLVVNMSQTQHMSQERNGRRFEGDLLRGEMSLMPSGTPSKWSWRTACDRLDVMVCPEIFGDGTRFEMEDRFHVRDPEIEAISRQLYAEAGRNGMAEKMYIESLITQLAVILLRRYSTASERAKTLPSSGLTRSQVRRVLDYIDANLHRDVALRDLASVSDLSMHHFARMFKRTMGAAPHRYLLERRVDRAKQLLRDTGSSLVDISLSLGFSSQSHFTNTFRRLVGATPGEFRTQS
jgi:AraC family transcriptional regulator